MVTHDFGILKKHSLKSEFDKENNFNDWLADNLDELSRLFSVDFEFMKREVKAENMRVDILAKFSSMEDDESVENKAVVEVQLGTSDSTHLGQLITYGEQHKARYCIWVAEDFRPGHLKTIYLLNNLAVDKDRYYFPVVAELISIDDSKKILSLKIKGEDIEQPLKAAEDQNETGDLLWVFFEQIRENLLSYPWFKRGKSTKDRYYQFSAGINSSIVRPSYGWRFKGKDQYMVWIDIRKLDFNNSPNERTSKIFCEQLENVTKKAFPNDKVELEDEDNRKYARLYIHYSKPVGTEILANSIEASKLVNWSIKYILKLRDSTIDKMQEIADSLVSK